MYKIFYFIIISSMNDFQINSNSNPYKKRRLYYNIDNPNPNPKPNPNPNIFILNMNNLDNYKSIDPDELIIVYSSNEYSNMLYQTICEGGTKFNVKKIITSDSVINEYIKYIEPANYELLYPNCHTIQINSYSNNFILISRIIDDLKIIKNIEYVLNDYIFYKNSISKYISFTKSFLTGKLSNISFIKIINNITKEINCTVEKKIVDNIVNFNKIEELDKSILNDILNYNLDNSSVNNILLEYIDKKNNVYFQKIIRNIVDVDLTSDINTDTNTDINYHNINHCDVISDDYI